MAKPKAIYYPLGGGLDVVTPAQSMNPGRLLALSNFEPHFNGGYRRIDGFERFDGRPKPSEQTFTGFEVSSSEDVVLGSTVTGAPSGATGVVIGIYEDDGSRGNDMIAVTKVTGTFAIGDTLTPPAGATGADEDMIPDGVSATDASFILLDNDMSLIDEGVDNADGLFLETVRNDWPGGVGVDVVSFPMTDLPVHVTTLNSWTLRIRARLIRKGTAVFRNNSQYSLSPESDDTVTYQFDLTPAGGDSQQVTFSEIDAAMGFITRTATQAVAASTPAQLSAATIDLTQTAFAMLGDLNDGLTLEIDTIDIVVDFDGDIDILSTPILKDTPTQALEDEFLLAAQDDYRDDIVEVPGAAADPVTLAWQLGTAQYAIRNNVGQTAGVLHTASAAGWTTAGVTMADFIAFTAGLAAGANIVEGDTLVGAVSGATATIHRIVLNGGSNAWDGSGEGYFVLTSVVGGPFQNLESLESPALTAVATADGINITLAFSIDGVYEMINHNFFAGSGTLRAYGVNAVDTFAFEIDENGVVSPIFMPNNVAGSPSADEEVPGGAPFLVEEHRNYLWIGFPGGRYINSTIGEPLVFSGFLGSNEFGAGDELTGLRSVVGAVLVITTERETRGLSGFDVTDFEMKVLAEKSGSRLYGSQKIDTVYTLDDLGVSSLARTDAFGDFIGATVSQLVQPLLFEILENFTDSTIVRASNQYRMYFSDGSALVMYVPEVGAANQQRVNLGEATRTKVQFGFLEYPFAISRIWNTEDETGMERSYMITNDAGSNIGFVYEDRKGTNFDGDNIQSFIRTTLNFLKTPSVRKRFRRVDLEIDAQKPLTLKFVADMAFGVSDSENVTAQPDVDVQGGGGFWNVDDWDEFFWDDQITSSARANIRGTGESIAFLIFNDSATVRPFVLQGLTIHHEPRRLQR